MASENQCLPFIIISATFVVLVILVAITACMLTVTDLQKTRLQLAKARNSTIFYRHRDNWRGEILVTDV